MIIYKPSGSFFRDIRHFNRTLVIRRLLGYVFFYGLAVAALAALFLWADWSKYLKLDGLSSIFSFLGVVLSILLVFRTNTAYDRWWEGRKQWGALVNHSRNLAIVGQVCFPEENKALRHRLALLISNFCLAFKEHLREGVRLEELIELSARDRQLYAEQQHLPAYISAQIQQLLVQAYRRGEIRELDQLNFKPHTQALLDVLGACERIKKTPIPFSYEIFLRLFIVCYALILPFVILPNFGFWGLPVLMLILFAFLGLELMAAEIQDPFGRDCNDLPTGDMAHTIRKNVFEILEAKHEEGAPASNYSKLS